MRFVIWPNDHDPAHVHVYVADGLVVVKLGEAERKAEIRESIHVSDADKRRALRLTKSTRRTCERSGRRFMAKKIFGSNHAKI